MALKAGQLDRRVVLKRRSVARDSAGQELETWHEIGPAWARVERPSPGDESVRAAQRTARQAVVFTIRYRPGLEPRAVAVEFDGELYDVEDIAELGRREGLALTAYAHEVRSGA